MSRKNRTGGVPAATPAGRAAAVQTAQRRRRIRLTAACIAAAAALLAVLAMALAATGFYARWATAVTVGDIKVSAATYSCYFSKAYAEISSVFSMTGGESLESYYDEATGSDWRDLVKGQADAAIQSDYAVAAEARKAGWTLRPEDQAAVEEETALIKSMAESDGYADADSYLAATVGAGCNLDTYQKFVETVKLAESYRNAYRTGLTFDQSEIQAAYVVSPETFDMATFRSFYYAGSGQEQAEEAASKVTDEASFAQMARDYASADEQQTYADDGATLQTMLVSRLNEGNRAWLTDPARAYGDVGTVAYKDAGYFILFYIGLNQDEAARDQAVEERLREQTYEQWTAQLTEDYPLKRHWFGMAGIAQ